MAIRSVKEVLAAAGIAEEAQFDERCRSWRTSRENGNPETLLAFLGREAGFAEDNTLQKLCGVIGWPYLDLSHAPPSPEALKRVSTKVAFQYAVFFLNNRPVAKRMSLLLTSWSSPDHP